MIASHGGAIVTKDGGRVIPGSGGMVGGLSLPGRNNAWIGGAGEKYETFTPVYNESIPGPNEYPPENPRDYPAPLPGPTEPQPGPPLPQLPGEPGPTTPTPTTPGGTIPGTGRPIIDQGEVKTIMDRILETFGQRTRLKTEGPLYLFTPAQPAQPGSGSGVNMRSIVMIGAVAAVAWFAYKKIKG